MEEILHQLRLVVCPIIYNVLYVPGGCLGFLNHQQYHNIQQASVAKASFRQMSSWSCLIHLIAQSFHAESAK